MTGSVKHDVCGDRMMVRKKGKGKKTKDLKGREAK